MFVYLGINAGGVVLHWLFSPGVYLWIENAPIPAMNAEAKPAVTEKQAEKEV